MSSAAAARNSAQAVFGASGNLRASPEAPVPRSRHNRTPALTMAPTAAQTKESYEEIRQQNIAANRSLLLSLQLAGPGFGPNLFPKTSLKATAENGAAKENKIAKKERKTTRRDSGIALEATPEAGGVGDGGRRRSGRILKLQQRTEEKKGQESDGSSGDEKEDEYTGRDSEDSDNSDDKENVASGRKRKSTWRPPSEPKRPRGSQPPQRKAKSLKGDRPNPKIFGQQIGTEVGDWWNSRMLCSQAGVHAPPVCGIAGSDGVGCYSVALSGGYEDDVDLGYAFTFTGSGGRALSGTPGNPKNLRTAPQSSDQEFTAMNASLRLSCELKNSVRVIRGYKNHSPFAPEDGYRYDGLYRVEKCWREAGQSGFQVCKFAFVRLPNQPKIPVKEGREAEAEEILREMGFQTDALAALPGTCQPWTQALAKQRIREQREAQEQVPAEPCSTQDTPSLKASSPSPQKTNEPAILEPEPSLSLQDDSSQPQEKTVSAGSPSKPINDLIPKVDGSESAGKTEEKPEASEESLANCKPGSPNKTPDLEASSPSPQNTDKPSSLEPEPSLSKQPEPGQSQEQSEPPASSPPKPINNVTPNED
ncbi:hypothetical protein PCANC_20357 [Puccinia coronata f. sp. avenae]|uniref:YDG domain-containing protein n=1 Tax=Puccinia coronata f. sp. avenae TaxID=200324 RepID=A0A2N5SGT5_9BASI|nr:hypothetical protein PCASD_24366 [Puccinia coronata f. sp. avenae]PLW36689.1 hypothetical protein PCANC_20357 [Puccinia coronata f. sp. avenae]